MRAVAPHRAAPHTSHERATTHEPTAHRRTSCMAHGVCASYTRTPAYYTYFRRRCSRLTLREWGQTQCVSAAHHVGRRQQPDTSHPTPAHAYHDDESRTHTHSLAHATLTRHNDTLTAHGRSTSPTRHSYGFSSGSRQVLPVVAPPFPPVARQAAMARAGSPLTHHVSHVQERRDSPLQHSTAERPHQTPGAGVSGHAKQ